MNKVFTILKNEKTLWPEWWAKLSPTRKYGPAVFVALYWCTLSVLGGFRSDHFTMGLIILALSYAGSLAGKVLTFLFPMILTGILYDSMRYYADYLRGEVHVAFPYEFDKRYFGITTPEGILTPNEYWQKHTHAVLDFICGLFYLCFIAIYMSISIYHAFILPRFSKNIEQRQTALRLGKYVTWAFFWLNILGWSTYYWFPAAPPWYVADFGLGPARMDTLASPAGAARFDALLGTTFFTGMYGRSTDVFGAIPSLHIAYPLLSVLFAFQIKSLRVFAICFYAIMCFSAVYLNHHYILDILWGSVYAVFIFSCINAYSKYSARKLYS